MNCVYLICRDCKTYIDAGYRWAYWSLEEPQIVRPGEQFSANAVLNATTYWAVPGGGWPTLAHLALVRQFLLSHASHHLTYGDTETFLPDDDDDAILDWMEVGSNPKPSVRGFAQRIKCQTDS